MVFTTEMRNLKESAFTEHDEFDWSEQFDSNQSITLSHEILQDFKVQVPLDTDVLGIIGQKALHLFDTTNMEWLEDVENLGYSPN